MKNEFNVLIKGFKNKEEAKEFIHWYEGQGQDQDILIWLECRIDEGIDIRSSLNVDCIKTYNHLENEYPNGEIVFEGNTAIMWIEESESERIVEND